MGIRDLGDRDIIIKQRPAGSVEDGKPEPRPESSDHLHDRHPVPRQHADPLLQGLYRRAQ